MTSPFFAFIWRLKNINRWALMRSSSTENVQEHSYSVAVLAHSLALIRREVFGGEADPCREAAAALFHDCSEIFTGDLPTPVKYHSQDITSAYKELEAAAAKKLTRSLPDALRPGYEELFDEAESDIVRAADRLAAYIKCVEELGAGNREFSLAAKQTRQRLDSMKMPEVDYFLEHFMPAFDLTLDELNYSID